MREAELMARDRWTREELLAFQRERVQALVAYAVTNSPYYREALGAHAAERPLTDLPGLSKATLMTEFQRVLTDPRLRPADLQAHLASPDPSQSFLGAYRVATTHAQIVLIPGASTDVAGRLREASAAAIGATGAIAPAVDVQPVPTLEREPGGKIRLVRSA